MKKWIIIAALAIATATQAQAFTLSCTDEGGTVTQTFADGHSKMTQRAVCGFFCAPETAAQGAARQPAGQPEIVTVALSSRIGQERDFATVGYRTTSWAVLKLGNARDCA